MAAETTLTRIVVEEHLSALQMGFSGDALLVSSELNELAERYELRNPASLLGYITCCPSVVADHLNISCESLHDSWRFLQGYLSDVVDDCVLYPEHVDRSQFAFGAAITEDAAQVSS